jgi:hypothetical protein
VAEAVVHLLLLQALELVVLVGHLEQMCLMEHLAMAVTVVLVEILTIMALLELLVLLVLFIFITKIMENRNELCSN